MLERLQPAFRVTPSIVNQCQVRVLVIYFIHKHKYVETRFQKGINDNFNAFCIILKVGGFK